MKGYKTVIFNVIMSAVMLISMWNPEASSSLPDASQVSGLMEQAEAWITAVWAIGNVGLRAVTSTKIFHGE